MTKAKIPYGHSTFSEAPVQRMGFLFGDVEDASVLPIYEHIARLDGGEYTLHMLTTGGECDAAFALIDLLHRTAVKVTIVATGTVCSMGVDILISGHVRQVTPSTVGMIHTHTEHPISIKHSDLADHVQLSKMDHSRRETLYKKRTKLTVSQLRKLFGGRDIWLNAQQLVDYGIADEII